MSAKVRVGAVCAQMPDDKTILLPKMADTSALSSVKHVLVSAPQDKKKLLKWSQRSDGGLGACVSPSVLRALGGEVEVTYEGAGLGKRLQLDAALRLQALISLLTVIGAGLSAYGTWFKNTTGSTANAWDRQTATLVLIVAAALALAKFYKEVKEL